MLTFINSKKVVADSKPPQNSLSKLRLWRILLKVKGLRMLAFTCISTTYHSDLQTQQRLVVPSQQISLAMPT